MVEQLPDVPGGSGEGGGETAEGLTELVLQAPEVSESFRRSEEARRIFESTEAAAPWLEDYWALLGEGWSWRQAVYMIWSSVPRDVRWPATQAELATRVLGLTSDRVIREWRDKNPAMDLRIAKLAASVLAKHRAEIYQALVASATNPDGRNHQDRRMALEMLGDYTPRQALQVSAVTAEEFRELDTEQLAAIAHQPAGGGGG